MRLLFAAARCSMRSGAEPDYENVSPWRHGEVPRDDVGVLVAEQFVQLGERAESHEFRCCPDWHLAFVLQDEVLHEVFILGFALLLVIAGEPGGVGVCSILPVRNFSSNE